MTERDGDHGSIETTAPPSEPQWRKSSFSGPQGNCVELAALPGARVGLRNSRHRQGYVLVLTRDQFAAFLASIRAGELDDSADE
jgi:hypothetical protein